MFDKEVAVASATDLTVLIESIHDAGLDSRQMPGVMRKIADRIGAQRVTLWVGAPGIYRSPEEWEGVDAAFIRSYEAYYGAMDPIVPLANSWAPGTILTDRMMVAQSVLDRSEFYQDWVRPQGIRGIAVANFLHDGDVIGLLGAPSESSLPFPRQSLDFLATLLPHIRHAVRTHRHLDTLRLSEFDHCDALDAFVHAILIVDKNARIAFANRQAETLLAAGDVIQTGPRGIVTHSVSSTHQLHALISKATGISASERAGGAMLLDRAPPARALQVLVSPIGPRVCQPGVDTHRPAAMLLIIDSEQSHRGPQAQLVALFGLTPAEARVACEVARGYDPKYVADALCVMPSTVRTHLHHVFAKTGTRRQADLMRLIAQITVVRVD
jgi:DNA-binding CsgD family transcriptional regulator/PAS domain-containing protein